GSGVILLGVANDGKVDLVAGVTKDLTGKLKAGDLVKFAAEVVGGKGGGRPDLAMAGGPNAAQLPAAIAAAETWLTQQAG
ncbi:MAG: DHHA1 domain-containing protein, partial [Gammaproteobacteria bacterium]